MFLYFASPREILYFLTPVPHRVVLPHTPLTTQLRRVGDPNPWISAGKTNGFHVATSSELACCYNDNSVLENHHCALTFDLIKKCTLLSHLEKPVQQVRLSSDIWGAGGGGGGGEASVSLFTEHASMNGQVCNQLPVLCITASIQQQGSPA